jgi:hypothetical protein
MYSIAVKIEGIESRRRSAGLLHIVMGFFLILKGFDFYKFLGYHSFLPVFPVLLMASFSLFYGFFRRRLDPSYGYNYWLRLLQVITFLVLGIWMIRIGRPIDYIGLFTFAFLSTILLFSERRIFLETTVYLDEAGVRIPGYYKDHVIPWKDLNEVVIREDFITLFHVKQKYLQYQVMQTLSALELAKMNAYCKEQIENAAVAAETN